MAACTLAGCRPTLWWTGSLNGPYTDHCPYSTLGRSARISRLWYSWPPSSCLGDSRLLLKAIARYRGRSTSSQSSMLPINTVDAWQSLSRLSAQQTPSAELSYRRLHGEFQLALSFLTVHFNIHPDLKCTILQIFPTVGYRYLRTAVNCGW